MHDGPALRLHVHLHQRQFRPAGRAGRVSDEGHDSSALIESREARWDEIREQWISNDDHLITVLDPYNADCWDDAQAACEALDIDPHEHETLEYWVVDSWLAQQLRKQDENVGYISEFDWYVWCRTTSGQAISIDSCIEQITENLIN